MTILEACYQPAAFTTIFFPTSRQTSLVRHSAQGQKWNDNVEKTIHSSRQHSFWEEAKAASLPSFTPSFPQKRPNLLSSNNAVVTADTVKNLTKDAANYLDLEAYPLGSLKRNTCVRMASTFFKMKVHPANTTLVGWMEIILFRLVDEYRAGNTVFPLAGSMFRSVSLDFLRMLHVETPMLFRTHIRTHTHTHTLLQYVCPLLTVRSPLIGFGNLQRKSNKRSI